MNENNNPNNNPFDDWGISKKEEPNNDLNNDNNTIINNSNFNTSNIDSNNENKEKSMQEDLVNNNKKKKKKQTIQKLNLKRIIAITILIIDRVIIGCAIITFVSSFLFFSGIKFISLLFGANPKEPFALEMVISLFEDYALIAILVLVSLIWAKIQLKNDSQINKFTLFSTKPIDIIVNILILSIVGLLLIIN